MSINPSDYDLDELRKIARERGADGHERERDAEQGEFDSLGEVESTTAAGGPSSFRAGLYRELLPLEAGTDAGKPYLDAVPEHYAAENLVFEWLEFLLLHAGYQGATEALDYYESVGWITEECESSLNEYLLGLEEDADRPADLEIDDHLLSLVYVAKLASLR